MTYRRHGHSIHVARWNVLVGWGYDGRNVEHES